MSKKIDEYEVGTEFETIICGLSYQMELWFFEHFTLIVKFRIDGQPFMELPFKKANQWLQDGTLKEVEK